MVAKTGNTYISGTTIGSVEIQTAILGVFDHAKFVESAPK